MDNDDARRLTPAAQHERRRQVIRSWKRGTKVKLREVTNQHMTQLEQQPERVQAYFRGPRIKYAA
jgi:hypothetical protein